MDCSIASEIGGLWKLRELLSKLDMFEAKFIYVYFG